MSLKNCYPILIAALTGGTCFCATAPAQAPENFSRFTFAGHEEEAKVLSEYLWYHFHNRLGNPPVLFNKEYLLFADMWLSNAHERGTNRRIQDVHREALLAIDISPEGYVNTHQHFSHAHDSGWPFPLWTQSEKGPDLVKRKTAGWHFQHEEDLTGWVAGYLRGWQHSEYFGDGAVAAWSVENATSLGIAEKTWRVNATGVSPALISPEGVTIEAFQAPFLQLRWSRSGTPKDHAVPYIEWLREGDTEFGPDRQVYFYPDKTQLTPEGRYHSIMTMYRHPKWEGNITRMRISLAPGESDVNFGIDSFFTVYDTRHTINNPIFIMASATYFDWTRDLDFLRRNIERMRKALRYQQTVMGGLEHGHIRVPWPGHDGLPGWYRDEDGKLTMNSGHGIGNNYWDIMPFGYDDFYATYQYYRATLDLADLEEAIGANPGWAIPRGADAADPAFLRKHAATVKKTANEKFWNADTKRFYAAINKQGDAFDFGYTFLNLDAIWYGIATEEHARDIMDWLEGKRIVESDTARGADIYHWDFGPRATTLRNLDWYGQGWTDPGAIPWGGQVQDGGAVLGFTFYDLWARLKVLGPENAWQRLTEIIAWEQEVREAGGYRAYYADGSKGTTMQGAGTAGGIGIDQEFFESSVPPSIVTYGFLGLDPGPDGLRIAPNLPESCPEMGITDLLYRFARIGVKASNDTITVELKEAPAEALPVVLEKGWKLRDHDQDGGVFRLSAPGTYTFQR